MVETQGWVGQRVNRLWETMIVDDQVLRDFRAIIRVNDFLEVVQVKRSRCFRLSEGWLPRENVSFVTITRSSSTIGVSYASAF